jgi:hypothetical protein
MILEPHWLYQENNTEKHKFVTMHEISELPWSEAIKITQNHLRKRELAGKIMTRV